MKSYRMGIDVGGTFTDAVIIDNETLELVAKIKVFTTHHAPEGVAKGIIIALKTILKESGVDPKDVEFIAHGTTQATNALLEGDVSQVGVLGLGPNGIEGIRSKNETKIGNIPLAEGREIKTKSEYLDFKSLSKNNIREKLSKFTSEGVEVVVASASFGVDDFGPENLVAEVAREMGLNVTTGHEISKLYGLKIRTRTSAVNASILPKMVVTANMTEKSVESAGIKAPFMVMRGDGGVMNIDEMRVRPLLTILSGPAAGVAGALMYERLSDGIFLEVGGTSTDISVIKNGQVEMSYSKIGGHQTYMTSLDTRTVGVAGGSMIRINGNKVINVGPRSAHIAGLKYAAFSDPDELEGAKIVFMKPLPNDPDYIALQKKDGQMLAITLTGIANAIGMVKKEDYSYGNSKSVELLMQILREYFKEDPKVKGKEIMDKACEKANKVVQDFIQEYELDTKHIILVGGGGGAATVVPYLSKMTGVNYKISKNAQYISPIGVALAAIRDVVERTVANPTPQAVISIRREAEQAAIKSGALPETIEIKIEIDKQKNILRAIAMGATELRTKKQLKKKLKEKDLLEIASNSMELRSDEVKKQAQNGTLYVFQGDKKEKGFLGIFNKTKTPIRVIKKDGTIVLKISNAVVDTCIVKIADNKLKDMVGRYTRYSEGGPIIPNIYIIRNGRLLNFSGVGENEQLIPLFKLEIEGMQDDDGVVLIMEER